MGSDQRPVREMCTKCGDTGLILVMDDVAEEWENPEDVDLDEVTTTRVCNCEAGRRQEQKEAEQMADFEACLLPGVTLGDLPDPPFAPLCKYFDMEKYEAYYAKWCGGEQL